MCYPEGASVKRELSEDAGASAVGGPKCAEEMHPKVYAPASVMPHNTRHPLRRGAAPILFLHVSLCMGADARPIARRLLVQIRLQVQPNRPKRRRDFWCRNPGCTKWKHSI